ncbi:MAG: class I SAM-dependent methyltransferase [Flavobacteriaceae bacterium]
MKPLNDRFSNNSDQYLKYRPNYPVDFINEIIALSSSRSDCWDCGTGNGQVATLLAGHFEKVYATDISNNQIKNAINVPNIQYDVCRAAETPFPADSFDLITAAQAAHWFDFEAFYKEAHRVSRNSGILALWGYGLLRFHNEIDPIIDNFYNETVGPYWDDERKHIDNSYRSIPFPLEEIELNRKYTMRKEFGLEELVGYLGTWSSVKKFTQDLGYSPVSRLIDQLSPIWEGAGSTRIGHFPLFTRIGRIEK